MVSTWRRFTMRFGRWPRRLAALACLLLAGATALQAHAPAATPRAPVGLGLHAGEVGVPIAVAATGIARHLHRGDLVGVLFSPADVDVGAGGPGPSLVADRLRVLSVDVTDDLGSEPSTSVLLAADRTVAVRLARFATTSLRLVLDHST